MNFPQPKAFLDELARKAAALFEGLARGDVVSWQRIEQATGVLRYGEHWTSLRKKLRRILLTERGILPLAVAGVGLKLASEDEQIHHNAVRRQKRATRQYSRAIEEADAVPAADLSVNQRRLQAFTLNSLRRKRLETKRGIREQKSEARQTKTGPLKPLPEHLKDRAG